MDQSCFICKAFAQVQQGPNLEMHVKCLRCGTYQMGYEASQDIGSERFNQNQLINISGWIRENSTDLIKRDHFELFKKIQTPTPAEKAKKLIQYLSKKYPAPGHPIFIDTSDLELHGASWVLGKSEFEYLLHSFLKKCKNYIDMEGHNYVITPEGWAYIEKIGQANQDSLLGFIAMYFHESLDSFLINVLEPAILDAGYEPKRVDRHEHINKIDDEIISLIKQSKFVVADLTGQRGGVYFEAGYAIGMNLPVIWLCKETEVKKNKVHFDVRQYNIITWKTNKFDEAKRALTNRIEAIVGHGNYSKK